MWSLEVSFGEKFEEISMSKYLKQVEETEVFADETKFQEVEIKSKVVEEDEPEAQEAELEIKNVEEAKEGQVIPHVNREDEKLLKEQITEINFLMTITKNQKKMIPKFIHQLKSMNF